MALTKIPSSLLDTSGGFDLQGNITLGASEEIQFGGASELKIFNDGTNSVLRSTDNILIQRGTSPRSAITITDSTGEVALAYGGSTVFQTTSTGATVTGNLAVTGDLDITGNVNSYNVTDLDVTDQTITLGAGQTEANSGGSGIIIDGSSASILWDETNDEWDFNKSINVTGSITSSGRTYMNRTGDGNFINFNSDGSEVGSIETQGDEIVLMSVDRGLRIRTSTSNSIIPVGTARTNLDDTMSLGSSGARFTTLYLSDNILNWGKAGSVTVFNQDGTTADFRVESTGEQHMLFVDGGLNRIGMANSAPNAKLHIDSTAATGDATNPALQIGGTTTYRLGMYTSAEGAVIANANGDDGLQFVVKTAGEAMRIDGGTGYVGIGIDNPSKLLHVNGQAQFENNIVLNENTPALVVPNGDFRIFTGGSETLRITSARNLKFIAQTTNFETPGFTYHTNNYLYLRGGSSGLILSDDSGINTIQIIDGTSGYINFETSNGSSKMRINSSGQVLIGDTASHTDDLLQIETPASGGGHGIQIRRNDSNSDQGIGHIQFGNNTDTDLARISAKTDGSTDNAALLFSTQPNGGALTEAMRINSSGQVRLQVDGGNAEIEALRICSIDPDMPNYQYNHAVALGFELAAYDGGDRTSKLTAKIVGRKGADGGNDWYTGGASTNFQGQLDFYTRNDDVLTKHMDLDEHGDLTLGGSTASSNVLTIGRTGTSNQGAATLNLKSQNASYINFYDVGTNTMRLFSHSVNARWKDAPNNDDCIQFGADGNLDADGSYRSNGVDYAEYFESTDGTAIPVGTTVVLVNEKVRAATSGEQPIGVVRPGSSGTSVVGGAAGLSWAGKYLKDDYDAYLYDTVDYWTWKDVGDTNNTGNEDQQCWSDRVPEGWIVPSDKTVTPMKRKRLNPDFVENLDADGNQIYVNRESRDEWNCIGLLGQVPITKGQVTNSNWIKLKDRSASVELWFIK